MRLILAQLLWTFDLALPEGETKALRPWQEQNNYILWEKTPLQVKLSVHDHSKG